MNHILLENLLKHITFLAWKRLLHLKYSKKLKIHFVT